MREVERSPERPPPAGSSTSSGQAQRFPGGPASQLRRIKAGVRQAAANSRIPALPDSQARTLARARLPAKTGNRLPPLCRTIHEDIHPVLPDHLRQPASGTQSGAPGRSAHADALSFRRAARLRNSRRSQTAHGRGSNNGRRIAPRRGPEIRRHVPNRMPVPRRVVGMRLEELSQRLAELPVPALLLVGDRLGIMAG